MPDLPGRVQFHGHHLLAAPAEAADRQRTAGQRIQAEGLGQYTANAPSIEVVNTIIYGHTNDIGNLPEAMFDHSCASNLTAGVQDNINADPAFVDAVGGNYRLTLESAITSPCFNAGTTLDWMADATDLAGERRIRSGRVDMGAYEAVPPASTLLILR